MLVHYTTNEGIFMYSDVASMTEICKLSRSLTMVGRAGWTTEMQPSGESESLQSVGDTLEVNTSWLAAHVR